MGRAEMSVTRSEEDGNRESWKTIKEQRTPFRQWAPKCLMAASAVLTSETWEDSWLLRKKKYQVYVSYNTFDKSPITFGCSHFPPLVTNYLH